MLDGLGVVEMGCGAAVPVERVESTMWPVDGACGLGQIAWGVAFGDDAIMDESGTWECLVTAGCRPGSRPGCRLTAFYMPASMYTVYLLHAIYACP